MIVADTSAVLGLLDRRSDQHAMLVRIFRATRDVWILPWAVLPELDYILPRRTDAATTAAFRADLAQGLFAVEWGGPADLRRAIEIDLRYRDLGLGLVDAVVMAVAERLRARAIATLDLRHFGAVELRFRPQLWPRDFGADATAGWMR